MGGRKGSRETPKGTPKGTPRQKAMTPKGTPAFKAITPKGTGGGELYRTGGSLRLSGSFVPTPPKKGRGVRVRVMRLGVEEKKGILEWPSEHTQCPVVDKMLLVAFISLFNYVTDDNDIPLTTKPAEPSPCDIETAPIPSTKRTDNDELYRVYMGLCSHHTANDYSDISEAAFVAYLYRLGWVPLRQPVMSMLLNRAKRLAGTTTFNYCAFVMGLLMLSMMFDDPTASAAVNYEFTVYASFEKALKGILIPAHFVRVDGKVCSDVRWNAAINDLLFVYWVHIERAFKTYCKVKIRNRGHSSKLSRTLAALLEYEGWVMFAADTKIDQWLTQREMAQIVKAVQTSDKEDIIDYAVPADRAFLGRVCLDMAEFYNAIVRCAFKIFQYEDPAVWSPEAKVHRMLHHIFNKTTDLDFGIPLSPLVTNVTPAVCHVDDDECAVVVRGVPLCRRRGVYLKFEGIKTCLGTFEKEGVGSVYPVFPEEERFREPGLERLADMEAWRSAVIDQRKRVRLWNLTTQRTTIPEPTPQGTTPFKKHLSITASFQDGAAIVTPTFSYQLELSLSNDGLHFSHSDGMSSQVSYLEPKETYAIPEDEVATLKTFFQLYCSWNDPYNDSLMTVEKWKLFKNHFELVEPCLPVYSKLRPAVKRMRKRRAIIKEGDLRTPEKALREEVLKRMEEEYFVKEVVRKGKMVGVVRRRERSEEGTGEELHYIVPGTEISTLNRRPGELEAPLRVELYTVELYDENVRGVECPIFDEMATYHPRLGSPALTFPSFITTLARVCSDVYGKLNCLPFIQTLCEATVLLPRVRRRTMTVSEVSVPEGIKHIVERGARRFDVYENTTYLGVLSEGAGWVINGRGRRSRNPHLAFSPGSHVAHEVDEVVRMVSIADAAYDFTSIILRLVGCGYLLAPSQGSPPHNSGRLYCVRCTAHQRPLTAPRLLKPDLHIIEPIKATTTAAHIWERKGTISTLWWQPVDGEITHPQATMMIYGEDPTNHLYRLFPAFAKTQTLAALRAAIEDLGYSLNLQWLS